MEIRSSIIFETIQYLFENDKNKRTFQTKLHLHPNPNSLFFTAANPVQALSRLKDPSSSLLIQIYSRFTLDQRSLST